MFCQPKVAFVGYILDSACIHADPKKVKAISEYASPTNITDLRSFFGLNAQLADYSTKVAAAAEPLPTPPAREHFQVGGRPHVGLRERKTRIGEPCGPGTLRPDAAHYVTD